MTPEAREAMRNAVRRALRTADLPASTPEHPGRLTVAPAPPGLTPPTPVDLAQRFTTELEALGGKVHATGTAGDVVNLVKQLLDREHSSSVLGWDDRWLPIAGLTDALRNAGVSVLQQTSGDASSRDRRREWEGAGVGLTGAAACLAETGSIVVVSGPGRGRLASLLPPVHVALATRASLRSSLASVIAEQPDLATSGSNMVCITGPSRTADIEHTLSRGVHGPREIHVVFVD